MSVELVYNAKTIIGVLQVLRLLLEVAFFDEPTVLYKFIPNYETQQLSKLKRDDFYLVNAWKNF